MFFFYLHADDSNYEHEFLEVFNIHLKGLLVMKDCYPIFLMTVINSLPSLKTGYQSLLFEVLQGNLFLMLVQSGTSKPL